MPPIGLQELLIIGVVLFFLFGGKRLPELFKNIGKSLRQFQAATKEVHDVKRNINLH